MKPGGGCTAGGAKFQPVAIAGTGACAGIHGHYCAPPEGGAGFQQSCQGVGSVVDVFHGLHDMNPLNTVCILSSSTSFSTVSVSVIVACLVLLLIPILSRLVLNRSCRRRGLVLFEVAYHQHNGKPFT